MLAALTMAAAVAASAACPVERARYGLRGEHGVTAEFHPVARSEAWPSGLSLAIHIASTGRTYWWLPWDGGSDDLHHVRLTRERTDAASGLEPTWLGKLQPGVDQDLWTTDARYDFLEAVPKAGDAAPEHLLLPTLGRTLYYGSVHSGREDRVPRAFFDMAGCGPMPHAPADVVLPAVP